VAEIRGEWTRFFPADGQDRTGEFVATLTPRPHWKTHEPSMKAYDVHVDGEHVGYIERAIESTDRHYGRIRVPGKGRPAWAWRRADGTGNSPGVYASTRADAVAHLLGYSMGRPL